MYLNIKRQITYYTLFISKQIKLQIIHNRYMYAVQHNPNRQIFYIKLENYERAVLLYKKNDNVLDMRSVIVPQKYQRRGIARLLAEAAISYAVLNNYRLILTCPFMQRFYILIKNPELEKLVVGPSNIISKSNPEKSS